MYKICIWNGIQCRTWSDCSFRSSLIWACTVCSDLSVLIWRIFTLYEMYFLYFLFKPSRVISRLKCFLKPTAIPILFGKEEVLNYDPRVSVFHDVLSESGQLVLKKSVVSRVCIYYKINVLRWIRTLSGDETVPFSLLPPTWIGVLIGNEFAPLLLNSFY